MSVFFWLILLLAVYDAKISKKGCFPDYISQKSIQPIKGIFILLVFISHFVQYVQLKGVWDSPYFEVRKFLGQLVVVPFLFYSGSGMAESIRVKGQSYVKSMPGKRIAKVLFQFGVAVALFLLLQFTRGVRYDWHRVILAFTGWVSVGNSNWYIFAIVCMYLITWISYTVFRKGKLPPLLCATALLCVYVVVMKLVKDQELWCNTALAYLAGMWFAAYREQFEKLVFSGDKSYFTYLIRTFAAFLFARQYWSKLVVYGITSVLFALLIVMFTAKFQITNRFLAYCGEHLFSLFILQRIPMIALDNRPIEGHPYLYLLVCLALTFLMSAVFDNLTAKAWTALTVRKKV